MFDNINIDPDWSPVAIGGVGGSGTRLMAQLLGQMGFYIGSDLNEPRDNLWFTLLFKRPELWQGKEEEFAHCLSVFVNVMCERRKLSPQEEQWLGTLATQERSQHTMPWLRQRWESLVWVTRQASFSCGPWGWKEPNTHIFVERIQMHLPKLRYIHVARNGLDMAYSNNQNQLQLWGPLFFPNENVQVSPQWSLRYWCAVHRRIMDWGKDMGDRFLFINYDQFCQSPGPGLDALCQFLGIDVLAKHKARLLESVKPPESIGRFRSAGLETFAVEDIALVKSLGFAVE